MAGGVRNKKTWLPGSKGMTKKKDHFLGGDQEKRPNTKNGSRIKHLGRSA